MNLESSAFCMAQRKRFDFHPTPYPSLDQVVPTPEFGQKRFWQIAECSRVSLSVTCEQNSLHKQKVTTRFFVTPYHRLPAIPNSFSVVCFVASDART